MYCRRVVPNLSHHKAEWIWYFFRHRRKCSREVNKTAHEPSLKGLSWDLGPCAMFNNSRWLLLSIIPRSWLHKKRLRNFTIRFDWNLSDEWDLSGIVRENREMKAIEIWYLHSRQNERLCKLRHGLPSRRHKVVTLLGSWMNLAITRHEPR